MGIFSHVTLPESLLADWRMNTFLLLSPHSEYLQQSQKEMDAQVKSEVLSILSSMADLSNAVHWLPPGFLWAGQFPSWLVGLMGTISSLIGVYQTSVGAGSGAV